MISSAPGWVRTVVGVVFVLGSIAFLSFEVPALVRFERFGTRSIGTIARYERSAGAHARYVPVVALAEGSAKRLIPGRETWQFQWYTVGESVDVIELKGERPAVGGLVRRWFEVLLVLLIGAANGVLLVKRALSLRRRQ